MHNKNFDNPNIKTSPLSLYFNTFIKKSVYINEKINKITNSSQNKIKKQLYESAFPI